MYGFVCTVLSKNLCWYDDWNKINFKSIQCYMTSVVCFVVHSYTFLLFVNLHFTLSDYCCVAKTNTIPTLTATFYSTEHSNHLLRSMNTANGKNYLNIGKMLYHHLFRYCIKMIWKIMDGENVIMMFVKSIKQIKIIVDSLCLV